MLSSVSPPKCASPQGPWLLSASPPRAPCQPLAPSSLLLLTDKPPVPAQPPASCLLPPASCLLPPAPPQLRHVGDHPGAGPGPPLLLLLHPGGHRQALPALEDVPQGHQWTGQGRLPHAASKSANLAPSSSS